MRISIRLSYFILLLLGLVFVTIAATHFGYNLMGPYYLQAEINRQVYVFLSIGIALLVGCGIAAFTTRANR